MAEELIPGKDGKVRLLKLRTASHVLLRPIQRIYPLDIYDEGIPKLVRTSADVAQEGQMTAASKGKEDNGQIRAEEQTKSGRKVQLFFTISHVIMDFGCGTDHSAAVSTSDHFTYF